MKCRKHNLCSDVLQYCAGLQYLFCSNISAICFAVFICQDCGIYKEWLEMDDAKVLAAELRKLAEAANVENVEEETVEDLD